ncbi:65-kDa microtubule-associated protein 3-like [Impatiens glandulifera]|uniref:65-kDa microtubule-associated protein 3-like n=1 Tax=Impatiens glandulifera TaxID=253017 RepID=UPI001FB12E9B|nr:65-kDa microtubule-associated protein 3-like [Impatiens glandulifera]XP_047322280.1 65-kDa microtubule-associated protein 3-like [Impatiens glandulifera]
MSTKMINKEDPLLQVETTCGSLLYELQIIWDEVGESETERDTMLLELERECLEVYRRKVDQANRSRAQLRQAIADSEAELAAICSAMGERPVHIRQSDQNLGSLKEELRAILPQIEEMRKRKFSRRTQFIEVIEEIQQISNEIHMSSYTGSNSLIDESDLSIRRLEELQKELQALQKEKSDRLIYVVDLLNNLNSLCAVLGVDFNQTAGEIHHSYGNNPEGDRVNISDEAIGRLTTGIEMLREIKIQRMQQLQDLATTLLRLWNLMDTPVEEQQVFHNVTRNVAASEQEMTEPNMLSVEFINNVEAEVMRLDELKASKMKELVMKKRLELEEVCKKTHLLPESDNNAIDILMAAIESGTVDPVGVLEQIELQISSVKEESLGRKEILERVDKWILACEEECWLEEYNQDENRYNAGRGAHLTLKRAEKARALVNKLPGMMEALASKTRTWENERGMDFNYDGIRLLSMLEEYTMLRQEKEQERKRMRDQKKLQGQLMAEQEAMFGSKPSPLKQQQLQSGKKASRRQSIGGQPQQTSNRRLSLGGPTLLQQQTPKATPNTRQPKKNPNNNNNDHLDSFPSLSTVRRGLDIAGINNNNSPMKRKPFSPISSTESSKSNMANLLEELNNRKQTTDMLSQITTPYKINSSEEENYNNRNTPIKMMAIPVPSTPLTVSVPMQTSKTPAHVPVAPIHFNLKPTPPPVEENVVEYSFEERRFGFVLPSTTPLKLSLVQV